MKLAIQTGLAHCFALEHALQPRQQRPHQIDRGYVFVASQIDQRAAQTIIDQGVRDDAARLFGLRDHAFDLRGLTHIAHGDHRHIIVWELRQHRLHQLLAAGTHAAGHDVDGRRRWCAPFA